MKFKIAATLAAAATLGWALPATAGVVVSVNCSAFPDNVGRVDCPGSRGYSTDNGYVPGTTKTAGASAPGSNGYSIGASARGSYGSLGVSGFTTGSSNYFVPGRLARLGSGAQATWLDGFTIVAPLLAAGSNVAVRVTQIIDIQSLDASFGGVYPETGVLIRYNANVSSGPSLANACGSIRTNAGGTYTNDQCQASMSPLHAGRNVIVSNIMLPANQTRYIMTSLEGSAYYYQPYSYALSTGTASFDSFNTAHSYLTVLAPGASLSSISGTSYAIPGIPEPASWMLMMAGFGGTGAALRGRNRRLAL